MRRPAAVLSGLGLALRVPSGAASAATRVTEPLPALKGYRIEGACSFPAGTPSLVWFGGPVVTTGQVDEKAFTVEATTQQEQGWALDLCEPRTSDLKPRPSPSQGARSVADVPFEQDLARAA
jgi:hypothetical protein